ncbi:hypothetical protein CYG48_01915 [Neorhizobium sp. SOG26]|uniref:plant virulence effector HPE1-like domain-containing protein n=1 Tax=Neorhizobium sp. SOG26 TaxID=2060726 RepID=UPI000E577CCD|nr:plant virulence effector HPE1-like domain-containing protein [Neorhizobium sp. SOG26]AXV14576.1 hypothetical protein CYG48_01915 [Neorhizobium sp. SOG26]
MRIVLAMAVVLSGGTALASSITSVGGAPSSATSIVVKACTHCVAEPAKADSGSYVVPELAAGTQKIEVIEMHGEKRLVRTEAWFGGSPVVYVSKVPGWMQDSAVAETGPDQPVPAEAQSATAVPTKDGIDEDATTSAVESAAAPQAILMGDVELRVN